MRILYLHQYFNTLKSPGCTRSYEMARRLVESGHEVQMITSVRRGEAGGPTSWFETNEDGIQVHWLPVPYSNHMSYLRRIKAFFKFAFRAGPKAAGLDGDVILAMSTPLTMALPAVYAAKKNKIPMVFEVGDLWPAIPIAIGALKNPITIGVANWLERFAYRHSSRIITLSPGMKEGVLAAGYPEERISVIPNSCDLDLFNVGQEAGQEPRAQHNWLGQRPLVLYAGTIGLINGVDYLARLAAAVEVINPEIRFLIIGSGKEENKVKDEARRVGVLGRNFFMMPSLPKSDIPKWLSAADIAVSVVIDNKNLWANSANKFFDALAAGTPIAINYRGWQAELIEQAGAGLVLDSKNIDSAAAALIDAVSDRHWLDAAGKAAWKLGRERFDRDKLALQLENILKEAASEQLKGPALNPRVGRRQVGRPLDS